MGPVGELLFNPPLGFVRRSHDQPSHVLVIASLWIICGSSRVAKLFIQDCLRKFDIKIRAVMGL